MAPSCSSCVNSLEFRHSLWVRASGDVSYSEQMGGDAEIVIK